VWRLVRSPQAGRTPEPEMVSRATQMAVNKSTQVRRAQHETDAATDASDDDDEAAPKRARTTQTSTRVDYTPLRSHPMPARVSLLAVALCPSVCLCHKSVFYRNA